MGWTYGSNNRAPALQAQNPECKPQSYQKNKKWCDPALKKMKKTKIKTEQPMM
jgi:hypothetical protein